MPSERRRPATKWGPRAPLLVAVLLTGCVAPQDEVLPSGPPSIPSASAPLPSPSSPLARGTGEESPAPVSPEPTIPANRERAASVERDGVRLTIELERNPMPAGRSTWIRKTVVNTGRHPLLYAPCGEAITAGGTIRDDPWRPGRELAPPLGEWKGYLLDHQGLRSPDRYVIFLPDGLTGSSSGCGDVGTIATLAPGARLVERSRWDGLTFRRLAPPPTSRLDLVGRLAYRRGEPSADGQEIEVHLDAWIDGSGQRWLDPGEAADAALGDPRLTAILARLDLRNGNEGVALFDPATRRYSIGVLESGNLPVARAHLTLVDARTGDIVGFVDRDWDYAVDDYP